MSSPLISALLLFFAPAAAEPLDKYLKQFVDMVAVVQAEAADPVDMTKAFYEGAIPGMLRRLDPHSVFFDPGQFAQLKELEKSTRKGFGSVVSILPGRVIVLQTLPGTPSAKSGISPGDEIIAINNIRLDRLEIEQLIQLLTQSRQKEVHLHVRRPGSARILQFVLTPEDVDAPSVERVFHVRPQIGYIRVSSFDAPTGKELKEGIEKLGGANLKGLILDLRNNMGGLLPPALETAALFLKPGQKILSVRGRSVTGEEVTVPESAVPYTFPLAVLINGKSASASEIVAGALQDHDRAAIVGENSFGKGLVQSVFPLSEGTGMALTTAFYYTPSGRSIQKHLATGQLQAEEVEKEYHTDSGRPVKGGGGIQPDRVVPPEGVTRLRAVLEATGSFTSFATSYLQKHRNVSPDLEIDSGILDEFQAVLSQNNIRPGIGEWSQEREWIRSRLEQEILNQAVGVEKGDEVEAQRDPQVEAALEAIGAL
ncbi:MAG: S41 family peptidase [Bryobacteraceae bacterium]